MVEHSATVPYSAVIAEASVYVKTSFAERLKILRESWAKAGSCTTRTVRLALYDSLYDSLTRFQQGCKPTCCNIAHAHWI